VYRAAAVAALTNYAPELKGFIVRVYGGNMANAPGWICWCCRILLMIIDMMVQANWITIEACYA
jgi:hypothetical protein